MDELKTIVIADDYSGTRAGLGEFFGIMGFNVYTAANGRDALSYIKTINESDQKPSLLITDLNMAPMGGYELVNKLGEAGFDFPVLVYSGEDKLDKSKINYDGKFDFLLKSGSFDELTTKVNQLLE